MRNLIPMIVSCLCVCSAHPVMAQFEGTHQVDSMINEYKKQLKESSLFVREHLDITEKEMIKLLDAQPAFAVYRDTYFVTGIPLNEKITTSSADVNFQFSIRQRLTQSLLPFNTFAYLTYSQKSFWNVYAESSPFKDNNYNPGIGLGKYIIRNNRLYGGVFALIEHESNGQGDEKSRSWNRFSLSAKYFFNRQLSLEAKLWIPVVDGEHNKDLLAYRGIGTLFFDYMNKDQRWWFSAEVTPREGWGNCNTMLAVAFRITPSSNQYLFARFYSGKGESLLEYKQNKTNIRVGICIKPNFFAIF